MLIRAIRCATFCLALAPVAGAGEPHPGTSLGANSDVPAKTIPVVHTSALNGEMVDLPASLKGRSGVLVVGFSQGSRSDVTEWGRRLSIDFHDSPSLRYYELAVLAGVPKFLRGYVLRKVAADVPEHAKSHFLPIDDHEAEWRSAADYRKADDAYVLVVDGNGQVRWRVEGPATDANYQQMKQHLEALRPVS